MLVGSNVLRFRQDIGHNNALPFCRQDAILGSFVQGNELVVGRSQVVHPQSGTYHCDIHLDIEHHLDPQAIPHLVCTFQA